jgi:hypothetical protein
MQALMAVLLALAAAPAVPKPIFATKSESAFIDDGFALSPQGDRLAYIRTNGADVVQVEIVSLPAGKTDATFSIAQFTKTPERVLFTADGKHLVVVSKAPEEDKREAQAYDLAGKPAGKKIGPTQQIAVSSVDGKPAVVTFSDKDKEGVHTYEVVAYAADGKQFGKKTLAADKTGLMKEKAAGPDGFKVVYWFDDFLHLIGQKKGEYDKKNDVRRPDRAMLWDVLKSKPLEEHEIGDVMMWVREQKDRVSHPHTAAFAQYAEDLKTLELITSDGKRRTLELGARMLYKYEPKSLLQQPGPEANRLYLSLTVDPVNWEAVQHKHAEPDIFDLYVIDLQTGKPSRVLTGLLANKRALSWTAAGGRVAILHKHKGFDRGGLELEVYDLTP